MTLTNLSTLSKSKYEWLFKYKLYHLPFWFVYHYSWWVLTIGAWEATNNLFFSVYSIKFFLYVVFQAIGVYFNLYFLIPRFLEKGKYVEYVTLLAITITCNASLIALGYYVSAWWAGKALQELYYVQAPNYFLYLLKTNSLPSTAASMTLAMSVKLAKNWIQTKQREQVLEKEKLETELKFLKSQFNPHFLFNTINSIFVLINKNPAMATEALAKFSDLLRYQLYECNDSQIPIARELAYIKDAVELEKLRQDHHIDVTLEIQNHSVKDFTIAPFILMPFVENAFKHVSKLKNQPNRIKMNFQIDTNQLIMKVCNSTDSKNRGFDNSLSTNGIGLKNVQRRLDLLYPEAHQLLITNEQNQFQVILKLELYNQEKKSV
ncbi:MAG: sensor histidine kinase [Cyclobacteriaceae bacterium]